MEIVRHIADRKLPASRCVLTMGNFDGIHLGHQSLLRNTVEEARQQRCRSVVLTFEPHPMKLLAPERAPRLILTHKDKMQLLQSFGVDLVLIQNFDTQFANLEAREFVEQYLVNRLRIGKIWVGRDLRFGRGRKGSVEELILRGTDGGFEVGIVEPILLKGVRISSSRIRQMIEEGKVDEVECFLGRFHFVSGRVVAGHRRGRNLGFPTANIRSRTEVLPPNGVYATLMEIENRQWPSVTNIGVNPTFGDGPRTIESFLLDFDGNLYGESVKLFWIKKLRAEKKFATAELLVEQMNRDVTEGREIFGAMRLTMSRGLAK